VFNVVLVGLYVLAHSIAVPVAGHDHASSAGGIASWLPADEVDFFGVVAAGTELATLVLLVAALGRGKRRWMTNLVLLCGGLLWTLRLTGALG
jgi:lysylphosphatidylglycerol synthetase-like protein (DUF2156 family)